MEIQKYHLPTNGRTDGLTWVGARDACASKNHPVRRKFVQDCPKLAKFGPKLTKFGLRLRWSENEKLELVVSTEHTSRWKDSYETFGRQTFICFVLQWFCVIV